MNLKWTIKSGCLLAICATFLLVISTHADTPAFTLGSVSINPPSSFTGTRGWQFERAGSPDDILITQLGVFDSGGDGLINAHEIGLWRQDPGGGVSGTLLASATVPAGTAAPLLGGYRWVSISPVPIPHALAFYVVGAQYSAGDQDNLVTPLPFDPQGGPQFSPDIFPFLGGGRYNLASSLAFPSSITFIPPEGPGELFWQPNFQYSGVPEPNVWLLLSPALFYLVLRSRRCK
jgi:hypothetical protein